MKPTYILIFLLFIGLVSCKEEVKNKNIGKAPENKAKHQLIGSIDSGQDIALLKTYEFQQGLLVDSSKAINNYGLSTYKENQEFIVVLEKFLFSEENLPIWQVLDTISFKNIPKNQSVQIGQCYRTGKDTVVDNRIIALVDDKDSLINTWYADTKNGKILKIKNTGNIIFINGNDD